MNFDVKGTPSAIERNGMTGRVVLRIGQESVILQSPWDPRTHFSLSTTKTWNAKLGGYAVTVVKSRARWFGGLRDSAYEVFIDGELLDQRRGF